MIITQHYRATSAQWSTRPSDAQHVDDAKFELPFGTRAKRMMVDERERERANSHSIYVPPPSIRNSKSFPVVAAATWQRSGFNWVRSFHT